MSYDLVFWRRERPIETESVAIFQALLDGQHVPGLAVLPIDDIMERIVAEIPGATKGPNGDHDWVEWVSDDELASFQVERVTGQCWAAFLRPLDTDLANRLIDVGRSYGCPLYDPQLDARFDDGVDH